MIFYIVYSNTTGLISRHGICSKEDLALQSITNGYTIMTTSQLTQSNQFQVDLTKTPPEIIPYTPPPVVISKTTQPNTKPGSGPNVIG